MKYISLALLSCLALETSFTTAIKLTDPILSSLDGIPKLMDADNLNNAIIAARMLIIFMDGGNLNSVPLKAIPFEGKKYPLSNLLTLTYNGKKCTLKELAKIEAQASGKEKEVLQTLLREARRKFNIFMSPMMAQARGAKQMMEKLIEESCKRRGRPKSALLNWAKVKDGEESKSLNQNITSFKLFTTFGTDLINFIKDLVESCPKAKAQLKARQQGGKQTRSAQFDETEDISR